VGRQGGRHRHRGPGAVGGGPGSRRRGRWRARLDHRRRAGPGAHGPQPAGDAGQPGASSSWTRPLGAGDPADSRARPQGDRHAAPPSRRHRLRVFQGAASLAGVLLHRSAPRPASLGAQGDRAGADRRPQRSGAGVMERLPGGLDDGPGLSGRLRPQGQRAVRLAPTVGAVRGSLRRSPPAAVDATSRSPRTGQLLGIAGVLQPWGHRGLGPAGVSPAGLPAGAHAAGRPRPRGSPVARRRQAPRCWCRRPGWR
jgi:hypothetical protein